MSLAIKYERLEDASMRLKSTVVLYEGKPYYIRELTTGQGDEGPYRVYADALPHTRATDPADIRKYISSKKFDVAPFPMGYVNEEGGCFYVARSPARQQKQGLSSENCTATTVFGGKKTFTTAIASSGFPDMVAGIYPTLAAAVRVLTVGVTKSIALSREFALATDESLPELTYLFFKNKKVGFLNGADVCLSEKYAYLKESLRETL